MLHALDGETPTIAELLGIEGTELPRPSVETAFDIPRVGRVRVHAYMTERGLAAAVRLLPPEAPSFESLHMPIAFDDLVTLPHGLVLVCGATGSGKSTTLAALAREAMRKRSIVMVTLEDPIEYSLDPSDGSIVRRRQIGRDVTDFNAGLRDALREDPDVLLVGEMRDAETIALALTAAETGHLVLASLHSRGAAAAIERIVDASVGERRNQVRVQLAESLRAVIGQRLVPRARGSGRVPAVEVLRVNHAVAAIIREGRTTQIGSTIQSSRREGMITLERCLADLVMARDITVDAARAAANDIELLNTFLAKT
jgi:twitching motility protein PilT